MFNYDFFFFIFIVLFFAIFLQFEQKLFSFFKFIFSVCLSLRSLLFFLLLLLFLSFFLMMFFSSFFGTEHSFQVLRTFILVKYDSSMSLTTMMIMMFFVFMGIKVLLLNFGHFDKVVYKSVILIICIEELL